MNIKRISSTLAFIALFLIVLQAQDKVLTIDDMARWKYIKSVQLSPNGTWVSYAEEAEEGDPIAHFYKVDEGKTYSFTTSSKPQMSLSEEWAVFKKSPPELLLKELKRKKTDKKDLPEDTLAIFQFNTNTIEKIAGLQRVELPDSLPEYVVYSTSAPFTAEDSTDVDPWKPRNDDNGYFLIIHEVVQNVRDTIFFAKDWKLSPQGHRLIAHTTAIDSNDVDRWISYSLPTKQKYTLYEGKGDVKKYSFTEDGRSLALIMDTDTTKAYERQFGLHVGRFDQAIREANLVRGENDMEIHPKGELSFSKDGSRLFFMQRNPPLQKDTLQLSEELVDVEIWNTKDPYIYPMQEKEKGDKEKEGQLFVLEVSSNVAQPLTNEYYNRYSFSHDKNAPWLVTYHNEKYAEHITWSGHDYKDVQLVNVTNGQTVKVVDKIHGYPRLSPKGNYVYWWDFPSSTWRAFDVKKRRLRQWTNNNKVQFYNELHDYPARPWSYGSIGFNEDESLFFVYDRYDIWEVKTSRNEQMKKLTQGRGNKTKYRWVDFDSENPYLDKADKTLVHTFSEKDKSSGYGQLDWEKKKVEPLIRRAAYFTPRIRKAKKADRYLYTMESFDDFPDLRIVEGWRFTQNKQVSHLNPQKSDFLWGDVELVEWSMDGVPQTGMLVKPKNFNRNKKYPVIVNFYEKSSDRLHRHRRPYIHRSTINYPHYISQGYIIFNPDIHYKVGDPGGSAFRTVMSGIEFLEKQGFVDSDRIALQGHSWGGYQIAHILTKTDKFKCAESGAPVVNMTSAYGGIRWGSGMSRMFQYEKSQSRLGTTLWEGRETYLKNSPLFEMDKVTTPVLILHNDEDGAVPWYQGIEYYMALRRLGKEAWLLNYRGEPHWPVKFQNRKDFHIRMEQFFNHYLKDGPLPEWMEKGIPAHERGLKDGYGSTK